MGLRNDWCFAW